MRYPEELETRVTLKDGTEAFVRPVKPTDEEIFKDLFYSLSEQSRYQRFFTRMAFLPHRQRQTFVSINYNEQIGLVCLVESPAGEKLVGLGQYIKLPNQPKAEVALLISDDWQKQGLGSWLTRYLVRIARQAGITGFHAEVLAVNKGMLAVFEALPYELRMKLDTGAYHLSFDF